MSLRFWVDHKIKNSYFDHFQYRVPSPQTAQNTGGNTQDGYFPNSEKSRHGQAPSRPGSDWSCQLHCFPLLSFVHLTLHLRLTFFLYTWLFLSCLRTLAHAIPASGILFLPHLYIQIIHTDHTCVKLISDATLSKNLAPVCRKKETFTPVESLNHALLVCAIDSRLIKGKVNSRWPLVHSLIYNSHQYLLPTWAVRY